MVLLATDMKKKHGYEQHLLNFVINQQRRILQCFFDPYDYNQITLKRQN